MLDWTEEEANMLAHLGSATNIERCTRFQVEQPGPARPSVRPSDRSIIDHISRREMRNFEKRAKRRKQSLLNLTRCTAISYFWLKLK